MPEQNVRQRVGDLTAFIRKPFNLVDVIELVARVLSASQASP
jgi:hypothetical protein